MSKKISNDLIGKLYDKNSIILDHYNHPRHCGSLDSECVKRSLSNPLCGDVIEVCCLITNNRLCDVAHTCDGCVLSQAFASITCDYVFKKNIESILNLRVTDLENLVGMQFGPNRRECVTLALKAIIDCCKEYVDI